MKISKKLRASLERRKKGFIAQMPSGQRCHPPGSRNRKKGCSSKVSTRH